MMTTTLIPILIGTTVSLLVFLLLRKMSNKKKGKEPMHREYIRRSFRRWLATTLVAVLATIIFTTLSALTYFNPSIRDLREMLINLTWYGSGALVSLVLLFLATYLTWYYNRLMKKL